MNSHPPITPLELLQLLADYGVFSEKNEDNYGRENYALGRPVGGINGGDFGYKYPWFDDFHDLLAELVEEMLNA